MLPAQFYIASLAFILAFYGLYNTSKKIAPQKSPVVKWVRLRAKWVKPLALLLIILGFYGFSNFFYLSVGLVFSFILLMACASVQILYLPFKRGRIR